MSLKLTDKIVLITGASSGIGAACAQAFSQAGARVILASRRSERLTALAKALPGPCLSLPMDVTQADSVRSALDSLPEQWRPIEILVNSAGLSRDFAKLYQYAQSDMDEMIDTNIKGLLYVTRAVLPSMVERGDGHIINIGSIAGHQTYANGTVYCATKAAVRALSEGLKMDLLGTAVRVTSVDPGAVETEFSVVRFHGDEQRAKKVYEGFKPLSAEDVADVVLFCATRPAHVNLNEVILMPVAQSSSTLMHREPLKV